MNWHQIKEKYPLGVKLSGVIEFHAPFGVFVDIGESNLKGLIQIVDFLDDGIMHPSMYPPIGSKVETVIIGYTEDERNQIWLSMKPSSFSNQLSFRG